MKLSDYAAGSTIVRDADFFRLGYVDSDCSGLLAFADSLKYLYVAKANPKLACLITTAELAEKAGAVPGLMIADSPREVFYQIHLRFIKESCYAIPFESGIGTGCNIHPSAMIADGCRIGDNVTIGEQVVIRAQVWIGSNVTIEAGVKLGVDGILYNKTNDGPKLIPHAGYVRIHDHAILMTNSVVVRSVHDTDVTEVGRGSLIGLASIVGHEAKVHDYAVISNQCVLARRCVIGKGAFVGTQVMIKEHVEVGDGASVMAGSVVINDVPCGATVSGNFATDHRHRMLEFMRLSQKNAARPIAPIKNRSEP
jgi:acyl-[acyl carrier protein]--UDP-N-acetylglucosamine O-acyltransferase